jgi:DNA (cytosine-5)-methyltransferase 1
MREIAEIEPNGIKVISTFSGCGGSSLGYRMAGCTVLGANEFVPAAIETYRLNASPSTHIWTDDIRTLNGEQMLADVGLKVGELDILDGSPPCAAFSTAGKGSDGWGQVKKYSDTSQRVDDLFYEYARILNEIQPKAFVAENVEGLVRGAAKGYFQRIHKALVDCGYQVSAMVLDASWLGVPQARRRVIFIGMRNDLKMKPKHPEPLSYQYVLKDCLSKSDNEQDRSLSREIKDTETSANICFNRFAIAPQWYRTEPGKSSEKYFQLVKPDINKPSPTVTAMGGNIGGASVTHPFEPRKFNLQELRRVCSFPDDFQLTGTFEQRWERLGRSVPPVMMKHIAEAVIKQLQSVK